MPMLMADRQAVGDSVCSQPAPWLTEILPAARRSDEDPASDDETDRLAAAAQAHPSGPTCRADRRRTIHRASGTSTLPDQPTELSRPRRTGASLRTSPPRFNDPRRREEARQHPRRRRLAVHRSGQGTRNRATTPGKPKNRHHDPKMGYAEIHDDETATTTVDVLQRAGAWFADRGVTVERALSDNGSA